jgi:hypothetical protein
VPGRRTPGRTPEIALQQRIERAFPGGLDGSSSIPEPVRRPLELDPPESGIVQVTTDLFYSTGLQRVFPLRYTPIEASVRVFAASVFLMPGSAWKWTTEAGGQPAVEISEDALSKLPPWVGIQVVYAHRRTAKDLWVHKGGDLRQYRDVHWRSTGEWYYESTYGGYFQDDTWMLQRPQAANFPYRYRPLEFSPLEHLRGGNAWRGVWQGATLSGTMTDGVNDQLPIAAGPLSPRSTGGFIVKPEGGPYRWGSVNVRLDGAGIYVPMWHTMTFLDISFYFRCPRPDQLTPPNRYDEFFFYLEYKYAYYYPTYRGGRLINWGTWNELFFSGETGLWKIYADGGEYQEEWLDEEGIPLGGYVLDGGTHRFSYRIDVTPMEYDDPTKLYRHKLTITVDDESATFYNQSVWMQPGDLQYPYPYEGTGPFVNSDGDIQIELGADPITYDANMYFHVDDITIDTDVEWAVTRPANRGPGVIRGG